MVPLLDYPAQPTGYTHEQGVDWARRHGGVFSLNHPFSEYNRVELDDPAARAHPGRDDRDATPAAAPRGPTRWRWASPPAATDFDLDHYLRLWDGLSRRGVIVTGSGSSDAHSARVGWQNGNNFATRIRADSTAEEALVAGLRSGDVYMADPVLFRSRLRFGDRRRAPHGPGGGPRAEASARWARPGRARWRSPSTGPGPPGASVGW